MILLFLFFSLAHAHVPVFDSNSEAYKITDKSWGVYRELKKNESFSIFLDVPEGKNISFSINLAGSQDEDFDASKDYIEVILFGHNATSIVCDQKFTGWGYESIHNDSHHNSRRLDAGMDEPVTIPQKYGKLHFEPFGVGAYRSLAACQGEVPVGDSNFTVTVKATNVVPFLDDETDNDVLRISIGAGMAELFSVDEVLYLPVTITRTWFWDLYGGGFITSQAVGLLFVLGFVLYLGRERAKRAEADYKFAIITKYFLLGVLCHNIVVYVIRIISVTAFSGYASETFDNAWFMNVWISVAIHIGIPFLLILIVSIDDKWDYEQDGFKCIFFYLGHIILFFVSLLLIQTFWLGALAALLWFISRSARHCKCRDDCKCCNKCCNDEKGFFGVGVGGAKSVQKVKLKDELQLISFRFA